MKKIKDIGDNEIRVIGESSNNGGRFSIKWIVIIIVAVVAILVIAVICVGYNKKSNVELELTQAYYEPLVIEERKDVVTIDKNRSLGIADVVRDEIPGCVDIVDTTINDVPLRIYIPHDVEYSLHVGPIDKGDTTIVYAAQAADIRADNGGIVGAFVLKGEPLARGLSKKGYCAIIDREVCVGVAESSPLFERATEREGYFFRQFAFVDNGVLVENKPRGKYVRRAICSYFGSIIIIESLTKESCHDFAQVLVDFGVSNAVSLVGGTAYGWAIDGDGIRHEFGEEKIFSVSDKMKRNINYLVCRKK
jgi:hypothetical protein